MKKIINGDYHSKTSTRITSQASMTINYNELFFQGARFESEDDVFFEIDAKTLESKDSARVACIGAGVNSLACAAELAKAGCLVTVFEKKEKSEAMPTYGMVSDTQGDKNKEEGFDSLGSLGIEFKFGREADISELKAFDAIFVGTGLNKVNLPKIGGSGLEGVYAGVDYLREARALKKGFIPGKQVVVIGGGDAAIDCAVTAKVSGAEKVVIAARHSLAGAVDIMPEFAYAASLGINFFSNVTPKMINGTDRVEYIVLKNGEHDEEHNGELKMTCDTVVFTVGQSGKYLGEKLRANNVFAAQETEGEVSKEEAAQNGRAAAVTILEYLRTRLGEGFGN